MSDIVEKKPVDPRALATKAQTQLNDPEFWAIAEPYYRDMKSEWNDVYEKPSSEAYYDYRESFDSLVNGMLAVQGDADLYRRTVNALKGEASEAASTVTQLAEMGLDGENYDTRRAALILGAKSAEQNPDAAYSSNLVAKLAAFARAEMEAYKKLSWDNKEEEAEQHHGLAFCAVRLLKPLVHKGLGLETRQSRQTLAADLEAIKGYDYIRFWENYGPTGLRAQSLETVVDYVDKGIDAVVAEAFRETMPGYTRAIDDGDAEEFLAAIAIKVEQDKGLATPDVAEKALAIFGECTRIDPYKRLHEPLLRTVFAVSEAHPEERKKAVDKLVEIVCMGRDDDTRMNAMDVLGTWVEKHPDKLGYRNAVQIAKVFPMFAVGLNINCDWQTAKNAVEKFYTLTDKLVDGSPAAGKGLPGFGVDVRGQTVSMEFNPVTQTFSGDLALIYRAELVSQNAYRLAKALETTEPTVEPESAPQQISAPLDPQERQRNYWAEKRYRRTVLSPRR